MQPTSRRASAVVPRLLPVLFGRGDAARAAMHDAHDALAAAPALEYSALDRRCREIADYDAGPGWRELRPLQLDAFSSVDPLDVAALGLASFHRDGRVRERAVRRLDEARGAGELPFLVLRVNDWVREVADPALAAVERRLTSACAADVVRCLPLLERLADADRRRDRRGLLASALALLREPAHRPALLAGFASRDRTVRRLAFRLLLETTGDPASLAPLLEAALRTDDLVLRTRAVAEARGRLGRDELVALAALMLRDPFMPVRRAALALLVEAAPETGRVHLSEALLDRHRAVREAARFWLLRRFAFPAFADVYRVHTTAPSPPARLAAAVAGLGETGTVADAAVVLPLLDHERPAVRAAAVRALGRLDAAGHRPRLLAALDDPSPAVSRAARGILRAGEPGLSAAELESRITGAAHPHARLGALALADRVGKWEGLRLLLVGSASALPAVRAEARRRLAQWLARVNTRFAEPTVADLDAIEAAIEAARHTLERRTATELRAIVAFWRRQARPAPGARRR